MMDRNERSKNKTIFKQKVDIMSEITFCDRYIERMQNRKVKLQKQLKDLEI
jgi:hypothetical protein